MSLPGDDDDLTVDPTEVAPEVQAPDQGEPFIGFSDEEGDPEPETPLIKKLRDQNRKLSRELSATRRTPQNDADPEPTVPARPHLERDFNFDQDRFDEALDTYEAAKEARIRWEAREEKRKDERQRAAEDQSRSIEQQKKSLGVADYDVHAATVHATLSDAQIGVLLTGCDNPAALIYALGRSPAKLEAVAAEGNLAKFAVALGALQKDLKMGRKRPPEPETQVHGSSASIGDNADKELARLEKEADRTNDRSKVIAYKRELRRAAA